MEDAMKKMLAAMVMFGVLFAAPGVFAQDAGPSAGEAMGTAGNDGVVYKKETNYDFEADDVEGALVKPDGEQITGDNRGKTSSLIRIRADFIPEMIKSVEDI